jgi:L,D-transpeptidase catalytic domain
MITSRAKTIAVLAAFVLFAACSSHKSKPTKSVGYTLVKPHAKPPVDRTQSYLPAPKLNGQSTVADVLEDFGPYVAKKFNYYFAKANVNYPPREVILVALKQEKKMELWARDQGEFRFIRDYHIMAASGDPGPKLHQGDRQVPEGIYRITELNPNSHYHLSMKINYPNEFDLLHAGLEGRHSPGSAIFIHGKAASIGCLAMGDDVIEELFVLVAQVGMENVKIVISPHDPRLYPLGAESKNSPKWLSGLYWFISREIEALTHGVGSLKTGLFPNHNLTE